MIFGTQLRRATPAILLTLTMLFWGSNAVIGRAASYHIPTTGLAFWAWAIAFFVITPWALPRVIRQRQLIYRHWMILILLGFFGIGLFPQFLYGAVGNTESINVSLIITGAPILIVCITWLLYGDHVNWQIIVGMIAGLSGVLVVITRGRVDALFAIEFVSGDILILIGIIVWSIYSVLLRYRPGDLDHLAMLWVMILPALIIHSIAYFSGLFYPWQFDFVPGNILYLGYSGLFPTVLAYSFYMAGTRALGSRIAAQFLFLTPIFTAILAVIVLGEIFQGFHVVSLLLITGGLICVNSDKQARRS